MREVLFRGRSLSGSWVYGLPSYDVEVKQLITQLDGGEEFYEIDPKTLGEYISRYDNSTDNKKVFTGDIVKSDDSLYVVIFNEEKSMFTGQHIDEYSWRQKGNYCTLNQLEPFEIVGNVIDNPELLTEK